MKLITLPLMLALTAGMAMAADTKPAATPKAAHKATSAMKSHAVEGEVVSADAKAKTVTVKTADGESTATVKGAAATKLKTLKAGDKVTLTCKDNAKGEHQYVTAIKVAKAPAAAKVSK